MSTHNVNLCLVLSDTRRIINSVRCHILALSLLFVLPLSFSIIVYTPFSQPMTIIFRYRFLSSYTTLVPEGESPRFDKSNSSLTVLHSLVVLLFFLFTTASITHSTWNMDSSVGPWTSLPRLNPSWLRFSFLLRRILWHAWFWDWFSLLLGISLSWCSVVSCHLGLKPIIAMCSGSPFFVHGWGLMRQMIYLQLEWYLAYVLVVVESKSFFSAIRDSSDLVKGMRSVAFLIIAWSALLLGNISSLFPSSAPGPINSGIG